MLTKDFFAKATVPTSEVTPEGSVFACEQCKKMYVHEDALAKSMTCCGQSLKELLNEAPML